MNDRPLQRDDALALLRWYVEMGVDIAVEESPANRLAQPENHGRETWPGAAPPQADPARAAVAEARAAPALLTASPDAVVLAAREQAQAARTLDELKATLERFEGCALRLTASQLVFADGSPEGRVMFVGEAP